MNDKKKPEGFEAARKTASEYLEDKEKAEYLLTEAAAKAERNASLLSAVWEDLQALLRLARARLRGEYDIMPWQTFVFVLAAIVYFVNPFDLVPDFLPGSGYLDDATVIGFVLRSIRRDIDAFLAWEAARKAE